MTTTVDVLCVGTGAGPLAAAAAAARHGMSVLYARPTTAPPPERQSIGHRMTWAELFAARWGAEPLDLLTRGYLDEMTAGFGRPRSELPPEPLAVTEIQPVQPAERTSTGAVPPFFGAGLQAWGRHCLDADTGLISTRAGLPGTVRILSAEGEAIEVSDVGPVPRNGLRRHDLHDWLLNCASERGVEMVAQSNLRRLLISEGRVVGGVIGSPTGNRVVSARYGVMLGIGSREAGSPSTTSATMLPAGTRLCVSTRQASKFCSLALLREDDVPPANTRRGPSNLRFRDESDEAGSDRNRRLVVDVNRGRRRMGRLRSN